MNDLMIWSEKQSSLLMMENYLKEHDQNSEMNSHIG